MFHSKALGTYNLSFFNINLNTDEPVISAINSSKTWHIFAHEYLHFLQDLLLPYAIRCNQHRIYCLSSIIKKAIETKKISRPYTDFDPEEQENWDTFITTFLGDNSCVKQIDSAKKITSIDRDDSCKIKVGVHKVEAIVSKYICKIEQKNENRELKYTLGARDFLEYVVHKIIDKHTGKESNAPDFPYRSVDYLFERLGLDRTPENVRVCIAEYCLYNDNPSKHFFFIIESIKEFDVSILKNIHSVKNYLENLAYISKGDIVETPISKRTKMLERFKTMLYGFYVNKESVISKWIDHITTFVSKELNQIFFFSYLYDLSADSFKDKLEYFYNELGTPIVTNNKKELLMNSTINENNENDEFCIFLAVQGFFSFIFGNSLECPMVEFCKSMSDSPVSNSCFHLNFVMANRDDLCAFLYFIRKYNLHNVYCTLDK